MNTESDPSVASTWTLGLGSNWQFGCLFFLEETWALGHQKGGIWRIQFMGMLEMARKLAQYFMK